MTQYGCWSSETLWASLSSVCDIWVTASHCRLHLLVKASKRTCLVAAFCVSACHLNFQSCTPHAHAVSVQILAFSLHHDHVPGLVLVHQSLITAWPCLPLAILTTWALLHRSRTCCRGSGSWPNCAPKAPRHSTWSASMPPCSNDSSSKYRRVLRPLLSCPPAPVTQPASTGSCSALKACLAFGVSECMPTSRVSGKLHGAAVVLYQSRHTLTKSCQPGDSCLCEGVRRTRSRGRCPMAACIPRWARRRLPASPPRASLGALAHPVHHLQVGCSFPMGF